MEDQTQNNEQQMKKPKKNCAKLEQQVAELTTDLQRIRADFENYRKRIDAEKTQAKELGKVTAIMQLLPVIDNIERAVSFVPDDLKDNNWAMGIVGLSKNLDKSIEQLGLIKIDAKSGDAFDPEIHNAVQFDEESDGDNEIVAEVLQPGYKFGENVIRHAMVKVTKQ